MAPRCAEIFGHCGLQIVITVISMAATGFFGMGMNVDCTDLGDIYHLSNSLFLNRDDSRVGVIVKPLEKVFAACEDFAEVQVALGGHFTFGH